MAKFNCDVCKDTGVYYHGILLATTPCPNGCKRPESNIGELAPVSPAKVTRRDELARILEIVAADGLPQPKDLDVALDAIDAVEVAYKSKSKPAISVRMTRTVAIMEVSSLAYNEIKEKLEAADYGHALSMMPEGIMLDMHGIGLMEEK